MKTVIIIDDEPLARSIVKEFLKDRSLAVVAECNDGFEGLKAIQQCDPDLIFLDIQMPKINGFEMLELVDAPPAVIFTTAYDEYAIRAFEQNAVDYLLKPFTKERFDRALDKFFHSEGAPVQVQPVLDAASENPRQKDRIVVRDGNKIKIIPVAKIQYIEAADDYVKIFSEDGHFLKKQTMSFYENSLSGFHFVRIHRSYIVNTALITAINPYEKDAHVIQLSTGPVLPVSKAGFTRLKSVLGI